MSIRTYIAFLVSMMVNAVVFGVGAIAVLTIPQLEADAWFWLPLVVAVSFIVSPFIAWQIAPMLLALAAPAHADGGLDRLVRMDFDDADVGLHDVDHQVGAFALEAAGETAALGGVRGVLRLAPPARDRIVRIKAAVIGNGPGL